MGADDLEERSRLRTFLAAVGAMAAVALVLGLVVGVVALGAAHVAGVTGADSAAPSEPASLHIPRYRPTEPAEEELPGLPEPKESRASPSGRPAGQKPKPKNDRFTLRAGPVRVSPGERINLTGDYRGRGSVLEVQRKEAGGAWADFAGVTASVSGGSYETYVQTSRTGKMKFRMYSPASRRTSNVATVTVG
jgi:hypothetical protein